MSHHDEHSLAALKGELREWTAHVDRLGLDDRRRFVEWLSGSLEPGEFALAIDAEIDRRSLFATYLHERYGPGD